MSALEISWLGTNTRCKTPILVIHLKCEKVENTLCCCSNFFTFCLFNEMKQFKECSLQRYNDWWMTNWQRYSMKLLWPNLGHYCSTLWIKPHTINYDYLFPEEVSWLRFTNTKQACWTLEILTIKGISSLDMVDINSFEVRAGRCESSVR